MRKSAIFMAFVVLAGCGGGGSSAPVSQVVAISTPGASSAVQKVNASLTIRIPPRTGQAAATRRHIKFIAPTVLSVVVHVPGATASVNVSPAQSSYTLTIGVPANTPVLFSVGLFDAPNGTGNLLAAGNQTATVTPANSTVNISVLGIIANLFIQPVPTTLTSIKLSAVGFDADGNLITGNYLNPPTLADLDGSGHTMLGAMTTLVSDTSTATLTWDGNPALSGCSAVTVLATANGGINVGAPIPLGNKFVTSTASAGIGSLSQTLSTANPNDTIVVSPPTLPATISVPAALTGWQSNLSLCGIAGAPPQITLDGGGSTQITSIPGLGGIQIAGFVFKNATAGNGGAINIAAGASVTISQSLFTNNVATTNGGAIFNAGSLTVLSTTFAGNTAHGGGGAIENLAGTLVVNAATFSNNSTIVGSGGAIDTNGTSTISNAVFLNNVASANGGALSISGSPNQLMTSLISGGNATLGGGVWLNNGASNLVMTNSTIAGATGDGIQTSIGATLNVNFSTIAANSGFGINPVGSTSPNLYGTIVSGNGAGDLTSTTGTWTVNYSLITNPTSATLTGGNNLTAVSPLLGPLANHGGPSPTLQLLAGSPAIAGVLTGCTATDQRGNTRPANNCDMGAYQTP